MSDAQDLAVHASITTIKVKNLASDPELVGIGPYVVQGRGLLFMVLANTESILLTAFPHSVQLHSP